MSFLVSLFAVLALAGLAEAKVTPPTLGEIKSRADSIALVEVVKIHQIAGVDLAEAIVLRDAYKGGLRKGESIVYVVSRTFACDISKASVNERAILFLEKLPSSSRWLRRMAPTLHEELDAIFGTAMPRFQISTAGRGRLRVTGGSVIRGSIRWGFGSKVPLKTLEAQL